VKRKQIILLAAAAIVLNSPPIWAQGSKSESDTRLPQGEPSQAGKTPNTKDTPVGQSQSNPAVGSQTPSREGNRSESDTRLPQGEPSQAGKGPGTRDTSVGSQRSRSIGADPAAGGSRHMSQASGGQEDIRQAQEALKNQGHDPGPIDGVMGPQTRQALRAFQSSNGLKQTGMLDSETKQKLNIENSSGAAPMRRGESSSTSPVGK
jgi:hypothetical protein